MRRRDIDVARVRDAVAAADANIAVAIAPFFVGPVQPVARRAFVRLGAEVLVFVVPARRQVVVFADDRALARIDAAAIAADIARACGAGEPTKGLVDAVARLSNALRAA